jgi:hypothetical protein
MALLKNITLPSGHACAYWRIVSVSADYARGHGAVELIGYRDADARTEGLPPLADSRMVFNGYTGHDGTAAAYEWLRTQPSTVPGRYEWRDITVPMPSANPDEPPVMQVTRRQVWVMEQPGAPLFTDAEDC